LHAKGNGRVLTLLSAELKQLSQRRVMECSGVVAVVPRLKYESDLLAPKQCYDVPAKKNNVTMSSFLFCPRTVKYLIIREFITKALFYWPS
jgi:hypothetical protein